MRVELDNVELNIILQAMNAVSLKGSDAVAFSKIIVKLDKAFQKEHEKAVKAEKNNG